MWTVEQANAWYKKVGWIVGANFIPSTAVNQLEMWQANSFEPDTISRELGYAASIGFNSVRVFLHNLLWEHDREGFIKRIKKYLDIAEKHKIKTAFVFFDGVWDPRPKYGQQHAPIPYLHNSRWVQSPGADYLPDPSKEPILESYIKGIVSEFKNDDRVLFWDIFNEPSNINLAYMKTELVNKDKYTYELMDKGFKWAREINPSQPITSAFWLSQGRISALGTLKFNNYILKNSDIITFHNYDDLKRFEKKVVQLLAHKRPLICTEYLLRPVNGFMNCLPIMKKYNVGAFNWGLVIGKTQTNYPWSSWIFRKKTEPKVWMHDIFYPDGTPYDYKETEMIKNLAEQGA